MSRNDKIGAFVLGVLLFSGLFYFIYTTMRNPLPSDLGNDDIGAGDTLGDNQDLNDEEPPAADDETPAVTSSTDTVTTPDAAPVSPK